MDIMDEKQRLQLQNMIKSNDVVDQTQLIRDLKHSHIPVSYTHLTLPTNREV